NDGGNPNAIGSEQVAHLQKRPTPAPARRLVDLLALAGDVHRDQAGGAHTYTKKTARGGAASHLLGHQWALVPREAGDHSCDGLLSVACVGIQLHWRNLPWTARLGYTAPCMPLAAPREGWVSRLEQAAARLVPREPARLGLEFGH